MNNTYLRILSYAKPWRRFIPGYLIFSLLAVAFGLMNMALLAPLLDVIFDQKGVEKLSKYAILPEFTFSKDYIVGTFNFYMLQTVEKYGKFGSLIFVCVIIISGFVLFVNNELIMHNKAHYVLTHNNTTHITVFFFTF
jgi:subfamily B ATP-binding cassette protein MsbA